MFDPFSLSRRAFGKRGLGFTFGLAAGFVSHTSLANALAGYRPKIFTEAELAIVKAVMSRLIPADGKTGGAVEACAHVYLDQALGTFHARYVDGYRAGLAALDRLARHEEATGFATLRPSRMDALIARLERGEITEDGLADGGTGFFNMIRRHTIEGFLSDPMYGGNKEFTGWKVLGYHGVQLFYSAEAQQLNGHDERRPRSIAAFGGSPMW